MDIDTLRTRRRLWAVAPAAAVTVAATVAVVVSAQSSARTQHAHLPSFGIRPAAQLLTPFSSCPSLLHGLRSHANAHLDRVLVSTGFAAGGVRLDGGMEAAGSAGSGARAAAAALAPQSSAGQTSTTNIQQAGVDEPDTVKTDGNRVVTVTDGRLRVIDAGTRTQTGSLDLHGYPNWPGAQLLVSGERAIVLLEGQDAQVGPAGGGAALPSADGGVASLPETFSADSTLLYVDLAGSPHVTSSLRVSGTIVDARMVGTTARVVASTAPKLTPPPITNYSSANVESAERKAIDSAPVDAWLPSYTVKDASAEHTTRVPCASVNHPADYSAASMLTVYTVDPTRPGADPLPVSLSADGNTVYATPSSLYVASSPQCDWCLRSGSQGAAAVTEIHRFDIRGTGRPTYVGSGTVQGTLLSQYSLDEYQGALRVATTTMSSGGESVSGVVVLDATTLARLGAVGGLGMHERVYAVRFLGRLGYVVTYNQQDPLYVLDLADPHQPRLVGSLEISGFSSYLHEVGAGRLVGVGQDTTLVDENGGEYAHNEGRMVQLFDVSNAAHPARTSRIVLPGTGTPGDPNFDPHAFLYWAPTGLIVVPVANYGNGAALAVRLEGSQLVELGTVSNPDSSSQPGSGAIVRSMIVDGDLWTFSQSGVRVSAQSSLGQRAWIPFA